MKNKARNFIKIISKIVFSRTLIVLLMILVQIAFFPLTYRYLNSYVPGAIEVMSVLGGLLLVFIVNQDEPAEFKMTWAIIICITPVLGALIYLFIQLNWGMVDLKKKVANEHKLTDGMLYTSDSTRQSLLNEDEAFKGFARYMDNVCGFPVYHNTTVKFFPIGEEKIEDLKKELLLAKDFIFMEYFIIDRGVVWDSILEILKQKAKEGVEVRVMYDGLCSLMLLPYGYPKKLKEMGIEAKAFAPIVPFLSTTQNNRDHRKIVVIDGKIAYTGGVNLADEYTNQKVVYGHWKDVAIKLEGRAVMSFTLMFLQNWNLYGKEDIEYAKYVEKSVAIFEEHNIEHNRERNYKVDVEATKDTEIPLKNEKGFVIPYGDTPTLRKEIGKTVYEDMLSRADKYIHIMTPYFIVDREFLATLKFAAERGVDVKLILPHIPDKKYAFDIARTFYPSLLSAGVRVYEYTPGFVHAKLAVTDDSAATIGSVNMDYRSFYHHFECGSFIYKSPAVMDIEKDFQDTLSKCVEVDMDYYNNIPIFSRMCGRFLRMLAPLM